MIDRLETVPHGPVRQIHVRIGAMSGGCADAHRAVALLRARPDTAGAAAIGEVRPAEAGGAMVTLRTSVGGIRVLDMLSGEQLPRIC